MARIKATTRRASFGLFVHLLWISQILQLLHGVNGDSECPENGTRSHLTRCDKYFQCVLLPSKRIIWVSKQCDEGLIYDKDQGQCVVPDFDWECELGDEGNNNEDHESESVKAPLNDQENVYGVNNFEDYLGRSDESSGAGEEVTEESLENNAIELESEVSSSQRPDEEFSGDGTETTLLTDSTEGGLDDAAASTEAISMEMPITPDRDGTVKSYLQRLTQLIDGFRKNGGSTATDITPDQLNSFVVMHKIKSNKNYDPIGTLQLPENGEILKPHLDYILQKQYALNTVGVQPSTPPSPVKRRIIHIIRPYHRPEPEDDTRINIKSNVGGGNGNGTGSNSQIVVNRPEGSVLFNIARPVSEIQQSHNRPVEPSISQDTLKSVLELSKQLVSHQKYLSQKPNYLRPVIQPVYYTMPMPVIQSMTGSGGRPENNQSSTVANDSYFQPPPKKIRPIIYSNAGMQPNYNRYENSYPDMMQFHRPNKYSSEEDSSSNYVPIHTHHHSYPGQNYYGANGNKNPNGQFGYSGNAPNFHHGSGYYSSSQESSSSGSPSYNSRPIEYNHHQPPYYDTSGLGHSNGNYYNPQSNHYQNSGQYFNNFYSHQDQFGQNQDEEISNEGEEEEDTLSSSESPVKSKPSSSEEKPITPTTTTTASPLSSLQLLSQQLLMEGAGNKNKIIGINGNYMSYDTYKDTILPILTTNGEGASNLEVVACSAGVRHPNSSDCTRYYVCNPKNGDLLGYTCPPFTAFNEMARICDANSYALCKPSLIGTKFTIEENKRLQYEAQKALQEAKKVREQALQAQRIAELIRKQTEAHTATASEQINSASGDSDEKPNRHKIINKIKKILKKPPRRPSTTYGSDSQSYQPIQQRPALLSGNKVRRRYKCTDAGQAIPDVESSHKYFVCFRDSSGRFKRRSMSCSKGLIFCSSRRMCTLKSRC